MFATINMKLILASKQVPEMRHLSWGERHALMRRCHWKFFQHWQGALGVLVFVTGLALGISFPEWVLPEALPAVIRVALQLLILGISAVIYLALYFNTLRPYIREQLEYLKESGFYSQQS